MKWRDLCGLALELPEVSEGVSYRTPALLVGDKSFARLKEDGETVVFQLHSVEQQEFLCETRGDLYFITDHYRGYPAVLASLAKLKKQEARERLREAWLVKAPKKLAKSLDGSPASRTGTSKVNPDQAMYEVVKAIPRGRVATYGQVAELAGIPRGHRVAARALRECPPGLPWHRVLGKKDARRAQISIAEPEHRARQEKLLRKEGVKLNEEGCVVLADYGWLPTG